MKPPGLVLLIDDDPDIRETLRSILEDEGVRVVEAAHGEEALALLGSMNPLPDVILLDLGMPVMNGIEFRQRQLAQPRLAAIPVVVITAAGAASLAAAGLGPHAVLPKPFRIEALFKILGG